MNEVVTIIFIFLALIGFMAGFAWLSHRTKTSGGSYFLLYSGTTAAFQNRDKKIAVEQVVERNSGKKMEEQGNFGPSPDSEMSGIHPFGKDFTAGREKNEI